MNDPDDFYDEDILIDTFCTGCHLPLPVNDLRLCASCNAKLERDLIRARDWEYSATAFRVSLDQRESLRERVIKEYGADDEFIADPDVTKPRKHKRSRSRATQRKREIAARAVRNYTTEDVLQAARVFLQKSDAEWLNFSNLAQHLYETFYKLKPKQLGQPGKKYKSLRKFIAAYPADFELRPDETKRGVYWIRQAS
jgi:hypothetical protein